MRFVSVLIGAAALAFATGASAASVTVSFSPEFQEALDDELGAREGEHLRAAVVEAIDAALARRGVGDSGVTIDVAIVDADPNRPTVQQLSAQPGLDAIRSVSIGGAELHAVLRANGAVIEEVTHRRYNHNLADLSGAASTWTEAHRAIRQFAEKVADAYVAHASAH